MESISSLTPEQLQALLNGPALAPPPGVQPNFHAKGQWGAWVTVLTLALLSSTLTLFMRMYTKLVILRKVRTEDYAIFISWALFCGFAAVGWKSNRTSPGTHQWDIQFRYLGDYLYHIHVISILYTIIVLGVKTSILLQYLHIFVPNGKADSMYWICHSLIWFNAVFYIISTFCEIFPCQPMAKAWDPLITEGHCINVLVGAVVSAFVNSITDIVILILPQITIWRLQMPKKKKIQISLIFLVGVIACISAIIRVPFTIQLAASEDITWYTWKEGIWTYPEIASGIVAACLPSSAKFFQSLRETKLFAFFASRSRTAPKTLGASPGLGGLGSPKEGASPRSNARRHGALWPTSVYATLADGGEEATQLSTLRSDSEWEDKRGKGHQDVEMMSQETYELSDIDTRETVQKMVHDLEKGVY